MAILCVVINSSTESIDQLNARVFKSSDRTQPSTQRLTDFINAIQSGACTGATVQLTTRDTDPSISTSGTHSAQATVSHL